MKFLIVKTGIVEDTDSKVLSKIILYLVIPCVIINAFQVDYTSDTVKGLLLAFIASVLTQIILLIVVSVLGRLFHLNEVEIASIYYSNSGNLIVPIVTFILGKEWVLYGCVFMSVQLIFIWTHCKKIISRDASPKMQEVKFNYQNITAEVQEESVLVKNKNLFVNTDCYDCKVIVARDGKVIRTAKMDTAVEPLSEKSYELPLKKESRSGEYTVTVSFHLKEDTVWAKAGHEVAFGQYVYTVDNLEGADEEKHQAIAGASDQMQVIHSVHNIGVRGEHFEVMFSTLNGCTHFLEMSGGSVNPTEMVAALINQKDNMIEGIRYAQEVIEGSMTMMLLTPKGILAARDRLGRTPLIVGKKEDACCVSFESFAYLNLGYEDLKELGPGEIVAVTPDGVETLQKPGEEMRICSFLWVYYGYPTSTYEGVNVEEMRYHCGDMLAQRDRGEVNPDIVAGVPDSGIAHAIGYANQSGVPFARPFIKYTPTWPRSFMPTQQSQRNLIARMKLIPVHKLIKDKSLLMIDDSIVRGTQLRETTEFLYGNGAKEVHIRPACPPLLYGCKYLNFSRSKSEMDLITRRVIAKREGENVSDKILADYADPNSTNYKEMLEDIRKELNFTSLKFHRLDDLKASIGISPCKLCTYCWDGKE